MPQLSRSDTLVCTGMVPGEIPFFKGESKSEQNSGEYIVQGNHSGRKQKISEKIYALRSGDYRYILKQHTNEVP